jgi:hypothetical protein
MSAQLVEASGEIFGGDYLPEGLHIDILEDE